MLKSTALYILLWLSGVFLLFCLYFSSCDLYVTCIPVYKYILSKVLLTTIVQNVFCQQ